MSASSYLIARTEVRGPDECWPWKLSTGSHGYGQGFIDGKVILAHKATFLTFVGPIPDGMTVDHSCHTRVCQNPAHLRLKTNVDNASDNGHATKTHCPAGHEYTAANTYVDPKGHRRCRTCAYERRNVRTKRRRQRAPL